MDNQIRNIYLGSILGFGLGSLLGLFPGLFAGLSMGLFDGLFLLNGNNTSNNCLLDKTLSLGIGLEFEAEFGTISLSILSSW